MTALDDAVRRMILRDLETFRKDGTYPSDGGVQVQYLLDQHQVATLLDHEKRLQHLEART